MAIDGSKIRDLAALTSPSASAIGYLVEPSVGDYKVDKTGFRNWLGLNTAFTLDVAYVSPTLGNNSTATVGRIDLPFQTYNAALAVANKVHLLENTTVTTPYASPAASRSYYVYIPEGVTLTFNSAVAMSVLTNSFNSLKTYFFGPGNMVYSGVAAATASADVTIHIDVNKFTLSEDYLNPVFNCIAGCKVFFKANLLDATLRTTTTQAIFRCFNYNYPVATIGEGTKIKSGGGGVFLVGGVGTNPKIHVGAGVIIYTSGATIWVASGSQGGISGAGAYYNAGVIPNSSIIHGDLTLATWITEQHVTNGII